MDVEVIKQYQKWADRAYVQALTCKNHVYHRLLPFQKGSGITLICPMSDYSQDLGLSDYRALKSKVQMAELLWKSQ